MNAYEWRKKLEEMEQHMLEHERDMLGLAERIVVEGRPCREHWTDEDIYMGCHRDVVAWGQATVTVEMNGYMSVNWPSGQGKWLKAGTSLNSPALAAEAAIVKAIVQGRCATQCGDKVVPPREDWHGLTYVVRANYGDWENFVLPGGTSEATARGVAIAMHRWSGQAVSLYAVEGMEGTADSYEMYGEQRILLVRKED
jgi:hypothetical protein